MEASAAEAAVVAHCSTSSLNLFQHAASVAASEEEKENENSDSNRNKTEIISQLLKSNHWSSVISGSGAGSTGSSPASSLPAAPNLNQPPPASENSGNSVSCQQQNSSSSSSSSQNNNSEITPPIGCQQNG